MTSYFKIWFPKSTFLKLFLIVIPFKTILNYDVNSNVHIAESDNIGESAQYRRINLRKTFGDI